MTPSHLLLALAVAVALSLLGRPWLPFVRRGRGGSVPLGTRWALFRWFHPLLAGALRWTVASAAVVLAAWASWPWIAHGDLWSLVQGAAGRVFQGS